MRESFVIHSEYIEDLPKDYKTKFLLYVYNFGIHGVVPKCEGLELALWKKIQRRIEGDAAQYQESVLKNRCYVLQNKVKNNKATENEKALLEKYQKELSAVKLNKLNETKQDLATYTPSVSEFDSDSVSDNDIDNEYVSDIDSDNDNESVVVVVSESECVDETTTTTPSLEEIAEYCEERNNGIDAEYFYDYYQSRNWMVGKSKMKDWKAAIRIWEKSPKAEKEEKPITKFWEKN